MTGQFESIELDGCPLIGRLRPLLPEDFASECFERLRSELPWTQPELQVFGRRHPVPRLQSWHGDPEAEYLYSGLLLSPEPWHPLLAELRALIERVCATRFNSVLANLYRDGHDSMGWHADDEPELGRHPRVASLSLGAERDFAVRRKGDTRMAFKWPLLHNELWLMEPGMQYHWQHSLPRRKRVERARLNLTFRWVNSRRR
jgi:alkylated DNA repair dioxygenase AlkB